MIDVTPLPTGQNVVIEDRYGHHGHQRGRDEIVDAERRLAAAIACHQNNNSEAFGRLTHDVTDGFGAAQSLAYQLNGQALVDAGKNAAAISEQVERVASQLEVGATANFNATAVQATNNFNLLSLQAERVAAASALQAEKIASAAALQAQTIAATSAAKMAECCCEIKGLIKDEGEKTRSLQSQIVLDAANARIGELNAKLVALEYCRRGESGH